MPKPWIVAAASEAATKSDVLIALITVEGLIFAALAVTSSLAARSTFGSKIIGPSWLLSVIATILLTAIAVSTILAWIDLFGPPHWPASIDRESEAAGLLLAIVSQPLLAGLIAAGFVRG